MGTDATIGLRAKLFEIQKAIKGIEKTARNEHFKYSYASVEDTMKIVREHMNEQRLMLDKTIEKAAVLWNGPKPVTLLDIRFTWHDVDSEETLTGMGFGAADGIETAVGKAISYAEKYFLWTQFMIPRSDDLDANEGPVGADVAQKMPFVPFTNSLPKNPSFKKKGSGKAWDEDADAKTPITIDQAFEIESRCAKIGVSKDYMFNYHKVGDFRQMTLKQYHQATYFLDKKERGE
jgi:hypothetical protein